MQLLRSIICVFFSFVCLEQINAQFPGGSRRNPAQNQRAAVDTSTSLTPDTTIYDHFSMYDVNHKIPFSDTSLNEFQIYDPVRHGQMFGANLGNLGSSARALLYDVPYQRGVNFGYDNYDYYRIKRKDFRWFDVNRPLSDFIFSPGSSQQNFLIKAKFSRSFADSVSFNLDYQRINQEGFYTNQEAKSTYLATGVRIQRDNTDTYILGLLNANNEEHNGGISDRTQLNGNFGSFRQSIPVYLNDANTRNHNLELSVNNYYHFKDSTSQKINYSLRHEFAIENGAFKFYDATSEDILQYTPFGIDERGLRNRIGYFHLENGFYLHSDKKVLKFQAGIVHDFFNINQEPRKFKKNNVFLKGNGSLALLSGAQLNFKGHFGLASNAGDLWLEGDINLKLKNLGELKGGLKLYRYEPTLIQQQLFINTQEFWNNEFAKLNGTGFFVQYQNEKLGLFAKASIDAMDNAIFFDESKFPQQQDGAFTSARFLIKQKIRLGPLHFDNSGAVQSFNENIYNLPRWMTEHNLYIEGKIFKKRMLARFGLDLRLMESYNPAHFAPELGVFYRQDQLNEDLFKILDGYISFKIDQFRLFARLENINHLLLNDINYLTPNYPQFDFKFRLGAGWLIKD